MRLTPALINQLAERMRSNHPALRAANARRQAAAANVGSIRTWEDPTVRVGGMIAREMMRADEGDLLYGVDQKLPLFGKPRLARRVAREEESTEEAVADQEFQFLRRDLAKAIFRTALAQDAVNIGKEDLGRLRTILRTVENRYGTGQATFREVVQVQNETSKRATQLENDLAKLGHEQVSLDRLVNWGDWAQSSRTSAPPSQALTSVAASHWGTLLLPDIGPGVEYNEKLVAMALNYEPKLKVLRQQAKTAEATADVTRRERLPEISLGVEARNYSGDGSFRQGMAILSMSLPWFNSRKYQRAIERDEARITAAQETAADYSLSVREEIHQLTTGIDAARREALLYRDTVIPRSETALESTLTGWESGRETLRDLLDAHRQLLDARLSFSQAVTEQYQMLSELVLCCGVADLEALSMLQTPKP